MNRRLWVALCLMGMSAASDPTRAQGLDRSMKGQYVAVRDWVREAAARMPEANYDFKPTPDVRSFGQLVGHIANSVAMICSVPMGTPSPLSSDAEKLPTKAALVSALDAAFSACDKSWAAVAPEWATAPVSLFGSTVSKMDALSFNNTHTYEHYGNVVTYLRLKGIVPPSSPR